MIVKSFYLLYLQFTFSMELRVVIVVYTVMFFLRTDFTKKIQKGGKHCQHLMNNQYKISLRRDYLWTLQGILFLVFHFLRSDK